ncbi:WD repeat-containing protein 27 [Discoglossus pictus]
MEDHSTHHIVSEKRSTVSNSPESHVQLACTPQYCAFPQNRNELCIWNTSDAFEQPIILKGHHEAITAVAIRSTLNPCLVCSASRDYVILWNLVKCKATVLQGLLPRGIVIGTLLGEVYHLGFNPDGTKVVACAGNKIFILHEEHEEILSELSGHLGPVTSAEFCTWQENFLVSISEDRTFKVWDYRTESLVYQSAVLSAFPLLRMYVDADNKQLVTGCVDGQLRVFSLLKEHQFRCVCQVDLQKEKLKFLSKIEKPRQLEKSVEIQNESCKLSGSDKNPKESMDSGFPILHIQQYEQPSLELEISLLGIPRRLWIGSSSGLLLMNMANSEVEAVLDFRENDDLSIQLAGSCSVSSNTGSKVFCLLTSMFGNWISLLEIDTCALMRSQQCAMQPYRLHMDISIVSSAPLQATSPLCYEAFKKPGMLKTNGLKNPPKDQPLVFHNKVKSSGYTAAPRMKMFSPKTNTKKTSELCKSQKNFTSGMKKDYPLSTLAPSIPQKQISVANKPTSICSIQYSGNGQKLACGLSDKSLLVFNSTLTGEPTVFTGHDGAVTGLGWSHDRNCLVSSDERTLRIWNAKNADCSLVLGKETFSKPVRFPQFYYMDKFILLSSGAEFQLLTYSLDPCKDEIKRYKQKNTCKPIKRFQMTSALEITGLSTVNDFYSYIVLAAGSNRSLEVFDLNVGCSVAEIPDVHSRAAHQICQNKGSAFSTQLPEAYNLFVTTAIGDGLKLWDVRTLRCVRRFDGHINRCYPCGVAISPCGRFIASGSEDRCAYIYDMRSCTYLQKLPGHSDSVISLAFNPSSAQLTTATLDGRLHTFVS